jgi:uncharacterized membrane protein YqhA
MILNFLSIKRYLLIFVGCISLIVLLSYPKPDGYWSIVELADHITNGTVNSITVHIIGTTATVVDGQVVFVLSGVFGKENLINELKKLGVSDQSINSLNIHFVGLSFNSMVFAIILFIGINRFLRKDFLQ